MIDSESKPGGCERYVSRARRLEARSRSRLAPLFLSLYRFRLFRPLARRILIPREGGLLFSKTWREILKRYYGVTVGRYSYGPCLKRGGGVPPGTRVGNYCSIAAGLTIFRRNHPADRISMHPFFYNAKCGLLDEDSIGKDADNPLRIGNDVWVGENSIILPRCKEIGDGAVIGAGSVVTRDVEPYTIVAGNPARPIKRRFPEALEKGIAESRWWERPLPEIMEKLPVFLEPLSDEILDALGAGEDIAAG